MVDLGLSIITDNPVLVVVLLMDAVLAYRMVKTMLHPFVGNYDIALILSELGEGTKKIWVLTARKEFNPIKDAFKIGKGLDAFAYKVDQTKVAFIQRTHRVYYYTKDKAYPMDSAFAKSIKPTTSKGMDGFIFLQLWKQALAANRVQNNIPAVIMIMCILAGVGLGFIVCFAAFNAGYIHIANFGIQGSVTSSTTSTTGTLVPILGGGN